MPQATTSMRQALRKLALAQRRLEPPPPITSNVSRALVVRGLMTAYPDRALTAEGKRADRTGIVPRIVTAHNISFARLEDNTSRPSKYRCYLRKGYDLNRQRTSWLLINNETNEQLSISQDGKRPTLERALPIAAQQVRDWVDRDSAQRLI